MKKKHHIAIIGSGVVGQATGKGFFEKSGFPVSFFDIDEEKIQKLKKEGYEASTPDEISNQVDVFFICIQTPTEGDKSNLGPIKEALKSVGYSLRENRNRPVIIVRSTVPVGTLEEVVIPTLEKFSERKAGEDFDVCSNPEFLREKSALSDFLDPRIIIFGCLNEEVSTLMKSLYAAFKVPIVRLSPKEAEYQKYLHNIFNATKISFFNEQRAICKELGLDAEKIFETVTQSSEAFWNPKYGIKDFGPYGGACLPKDVKAFIGWAEKKGCNVSILKAVDDVNKNLLN